MAVRFRSPGEGNQKKIILTVVIQILFLQTVIALETFSL